jgi:hypothetical protein
MTLLLNKDNELDSLHHEDSYVPFNITLIVYTFKNILAEIT